MKLRKPSLSGLMVLACAALVSMHSRADSGTTPVAAPSCGLPVCDIPGELAKFRAMPQQQRFQLILDYENNYREDIDPKALKNLSVFADGLIATIIDVKEEAWVLRQAQEFYGNLHCRLGLSTPCSDKTIW